MKRFQGTGRHVPALCLTGALTASLALPAAAAEPIGDGVTPTYDEAYYATLDYYGNLTEGSVVKSHTLNGASSLTDLETYDQVVNLTDGTPPTTRNGVTEFRFDQAPAHFYFEGKTAEPFQNLPWTLSLSYTLNGVAVRAEELAGRTGLVEITVDAVPNEQAGDYARYNYTLEAMAVFNQDDILSLEAPGAQVQLIGNLRAVLFTALPGEEHLNRLGADLKILQDSLKELGDLLKALETVWAGVAAGAEAHYTPSSRSPPCWPPKPPPARRRLKRCWPRCRPWTAALPRYRH